MRTLEFLMFIFVKLVKACFWIYHYFHQDVTKYHKALAFRNKSWELSNQQVDPERQMCSSSEADHIHSMLCTVIFKVHILCFLMKEMLPCPQVSSDRCSLQLKPLQPTRDICSGFHIPCAVQFFWDILASVSLFS